MHGKGRWVHEEGRVVHVYGVEGGAEEEGGCMRRGRKGGWAHTPVSPAHTFGVRVDGDEVALDMMSRKCLPIARPRTMRFVLRPWIGWHGRRHMHNTRMHAC